MTKDLLGIDLADEGRMNDPESLKLSFLSEEKRERLRSVKENYGARIQRIRDRMAGVRTPADFAAIAALENEEKAALSEVMTPDERLEYDVRTSPESSMLKRDLSAFQPSEQEFRSIFQAKQALEANTNSDSVASQNYQDALNAALGEDRYAEYVRSQAPDYRYLTGMADRFGLDKQVAAQAFDLEQNMHSQAQQFVSDTSLTPEQKQAALMGLRQQAEQSLSTMLGNEAYGVYRSQLGDWMERLGR